MRFQFNRSLLLTSLLSLITYCVADEARPTMPVVYSKPVNPQPECNFFTFAFDTGPGGVLTTFAQQYGCDETNYPIKEQYSKCQVGGIVRDCVIYNEKVAGKLELPVYYSSSVTPDSKGSFLTFGIDTGPGGKNSLFVQHSQCDDKHHIIDLSGRCTVYGHDTSCIVTKPETTEKLEMPIVYHTPMNPNPECNFFTYAIDGPKMYVVNYGCDKTHFPIKDQYGECQVDDRVRPCLVRRPNTGEGNSMPVVHHSKGDPKSKCNFFTFGIDGGRDGPTLFVENHECDATHFPTRDHAVCQVGDQLRECVVVKSLKTEL